jgi:iron(III) transport system permease protein
LLAAAFFIPVAQLIAWTVEEIRDPSLGDSWHGVYGEYVQNSVLLAGVAALLVVGLALIIAYGVRARDNRNRWSRLLARLVTMGYAMPGAVIAVGVLAVVNPLDGSVTDFAGSLGRTNPNYLLTGTIIALSYAYLVRFMAVGFNSVDASMEKIKPSMEQAARCLGANPLRVLLRVHMPLVSTGMAAGAILVFVDVMKELPATLLLRPFAMDTLALWTYFLAHESFWEAAAIPSLTIVAVGLIPVFILMRIGDTGTGR